MKNLLCLNIEIEEAGQAGSTDRREYGGLVLMTFLILVLAVMFLLPASSVMAQSQGQGAQAAAPAEDEEELLDFFFLEAVEGVEPSDAPVPTLPPSDAPLPSLPPSTPPAGRPLPPVEPQSRVTPSTAMPEISPSSAPSGGWTPLPELSPRSPAEIQSTASPSFDSFSSPESYDPNNPFNPLSNRPSEPAFEDAGQDNARSTLAVPLGQGAVPPPFWESYTDEAGFAPADGSSHWMQLEVGQTDLSANQSPAPVNTRRAASVYSVPPPASANSRPAFGPVESAAPAARETSVTDKAMDQAIQEPAPQAQVLEPAEREKLKRLFSDILPPQGQNRARADARGGSTADPTSVVSAPAAPGPASAILQAGGLLSEPRQLPAGAVTQAAAETPAQSTPIAFTPQETSPSSKPDSKKGPSPNPTPVTVTAKVSQKSAADGTAKAIEPAKAPAKAAPAVKADIPASAVEPAKTKATKAQPAKSGPKASGKSAKTTAAKPAVAPVNKAVSLIVVNETGRGQVAQQYSSVLRRLGYQVASAVEGRPGKGQTGQTVVSYRSGYKSQAQAVAKALPGKKTLVEAKQGQVLASEIMIHVR